MPGSAILPALLALAASLSYGAGDFTGGIASRRVGAFRTVLVSFTVGLLALTAVALATGEAFPSRTDTLWGALSGVTGVVGFVCLMHGLARGQMGVVSPVSAALATSIPVLFAALTQGLPSIQQQLGFALALVAIWLLARPQAGGDRPGGLSVALLAGVGFGGFFLAADQISAGAVLWPLAAGRVAALGVLLPLALARRPLAMPRGANLGLVGLAGVLDVGGNLLFLLAAQAGRLDVTVVLSSLYPGVTAVLAWWLARERMGRLQIVGAVAAIVAIVLVTR